jgi:hypothetical protein
MAVVVCKALSVAAAWQGCIFLANLDVGDKPHNNEL